MTGYTTGLGFSVLARHDFRFCLPRRHSRIWLVQNRPHDQSHRPTAQASTRFPFTLETLSVIPVCHGLYVEQLLHKHFHASRLHSEWFALAEAEVVSFAPLVETFNSRILNFRVPTRQQKFWRKLAKKSPQAVENARQLQRAHPEWCP